MRRTTSLPTRGPRRDSPVWAVVIPPLRSSVIMKTSWCCALSQTAAEVAVELFEAKLLPLVVAICAERDRLYVELASISGLVPIRSQANFMAVRSNDEPKRVFAELLKRDILIRDVSGYPMLNEYFRVSVGTPEENDRLVRALRENLKSAITAAR